MLTFAPFYIKTLQLKYFSFYIERDRGVLFSLSNESINSIFYSKIEIRQPISSLTDA